MKITEIVNLSKIDSLYDYGKFSQQELNELSSQISFSKYKNQYNKIRNDEQIILPLKEGIEIFLENLKDDNNSYYLLICILLLQWLLIYLSKN